MSQVQAGSSVWVAIAQNGTIAGVFLSGPQAVQAAGEGGRVSNEPVIQGYEVIVCSKSLSGGPNIQRSVWFSNPDRIKRFVNEEREWESCLSVQCPELGIDKKGVFA